MLINSLKLFLLHLSELCKVCLLGRLSALPTPEKFGSRSTRYCSPYFFLFLWLCFVFVWCDGGKSRSCQRWFCDVHRNKREDPNWCAWLRIRCGCVRGSDLTGDWKTPQKVHFFSRVWICCFFCFPTIERYYLNRCSLRASYHLRHPPIICFPSLLPSPSPLQASPLILKLAHPSVAPICVNTAYEGASHRAYIINAALTNAELYLFMHFHRHIR